MTREEFLLGWLLLTTQPWGKAYRTSFQVALGEPSPAEIQIEFYYQALSKYDAQSWVAAASLQAMGEHWPSIDSFHLALKHAYPKHTRLPDYATDESYVTKDEAFKDRPELLALIDRIGVDWNTPEKVWLKDGAGKPYGMPDPELPWPWQTDAERERRISLPYWQERFKANSPLYDHFLLEKNKVK